MKLKDCIIGIPVKCINKYANPDHQPRKEKLQIGHIVGFTWNRTSQVDYINDQGLEPIALVKWCGDEYPIAIHPGNIEMLK
ncbi:MAG: hypothetical protein AB7V16_07200 [Vulcanibacillus sp.]